MFLMFLVFATTGCALYLWLMNELSESRKRLPGPIQFPFIGSMPQVAAAHSVGFLAIHKLSQIYGHAMAIKLGIAEYVFVSSFESIKHFYGGEDCVDRPCGGIWKETNFHKNIGLLFANGPLEWGEMHKFVTQCWRVNGPLNRTWFRTFLQEEVDCFMKHVEELASSSPDRVVPFHASGFVKVSFTNLITAMLAGKRQEDYNDKKLEDLAIALSKFFRASTLSTTVWQAYPWLKFVFGKPLGYTTQLESVAIVHKYCEELISERKQLGKYKTGEPASYIDAFLKRIENEKEHPQLFSNEALLVTLADFYILGTETPSNWLLFAIVLLMSHPEKQEKLYQEIRSKVGKGRVELDNQNEMTYTQAVILEVFRWSKVSINLGSRQAIRDFEYNGKIVNKGTAVLANIYSVYENQRFWGDPQVFRPERFIDEDTGQLVKDKVEHIISFGYGKRSCLGEMLARDSCFLYLTSLIQRFRFELPNEYIKNPPSLELVEGIITYCKDYSAKVVKRERKINQKQYYL